MTTHRQRWEVLSSQQLLDASPWFRAYQEHVRLPNGIEIVDYYRIDLLSYTKVFALTSDQQVVMIEQYRHGPQVVSLELPAGGLETEGEMQNPLLSAQRELLEETGMVAVEWRPLGRFFMDGNRGCGWAHGFLALGAKLQQAPALDTTELMVTRLIPLDEVREMWLNGHISSVSSVALIGLALGHLETS